MQLTGASGPRNIGSQGGNYRVVQRIPCQPEDERTLRCAVTVEDDLIKALQLDLYVTDTFRITVSQGVIRRVDTSSNDPLLFEEALNWVQRERAERVRQPCQGYLPVVQPRGLACGSLCRASASLPSFVSAQKIDNGLNIGARQRQASGLTAFARRGGFSKKAIDCVTELG